MLRVVCACLGMALALFAGGVSVAQTRPEPIAAAIAAGHRPHPRPPQAPMPVRVIDQPLAVRVIDQPKTEAQIAAEQRDRADRAALSDQLLIFAALLVAVGAFLAIAFAVQVFYLGLGLRAMRQLFAEGRPQRDGDAAGLRLRQRADVERRGRQRPDQPDMVELRHDADPQASDRHQLEGFARRVAARLRHQLRRSRRRTCSSDRAPRPSSAAIFIPMRDIQAAIEQRLHLYVWGRATYDDLFEGTQAAFLRVLPSRRGRGRDARQHRR